MLKAEFRFFQVDFEPFLKFRIGVGHDYRHVSVSDRHDQETTRLAACPHIFF